MQPAPRPVWCLEGSPPLGSSTPVGSGSPTPPTDIEGVGQGVEHGMQGTQQCGIHHIER